MLNKKISIVVPFFNGNEYINRLLNSVCEVLESCKTNISLDVIIVNDSPKVRVNVNGEYRDKLNISIIENDNNLGIQKTRIRGLKYAKGDWIIFLDQDDELIADGFNTQINLCEGDVDVVLGNGFYQFDSKERKIYKTKYEMKYLARKPILIGIRNIIPSPGECLIKKESIPDKWQNEPLSTNGSDDWLLWILMSEKKWVTNSEIVYRHNNVDGNNLSLNLDKMYLSSVEMLSKLDENLNSKELEKLRRSIVFKSLKDTGKLRLLDYLHFWREVVRNSIYKINRFLLSIG